MMKELSALTAIILLIVFFSSCKRDCCDLGPDSNRAILDFAVQDSAGNDLIRSGLISEENIITYYKQGDGTYDDYYGEVTMGAGSFERRGVDILGSEIRVYLNLQKQGVNSITVIDWGVESLKMDTLNTTFEESSDNLFTEVRVNGDLFWKPNQNEELVLLKSIN